MSKLHRYRIPRWPHDARTAIFRWSPDFLTSDGDRQVPRQSLLDDLPIAVGASAEILVILKVNRAATEQSPGGGRQTSGAWLLRPGSRSKKSGDHLPMPQNRNRRKIGGSLCDSKSLWRRLKAPQWCCWGHWIFIICNLYNCPYFRPKIRKGKGT